jgi:hypothetical protein
MNEKEAADHIPSCARSAHHIEVFVRLDGAVVAEQHLQYMELRHTPNTSSV